jgi:hypothetical protein
MTKYGIISSRVALPTIVNRFCNQPVIIYVVGLTDTKIDKLSLFTVPFSHANTKLFQIGDSSELVALSLSTAVRPFQGSEICHLNFEACAHK